MPVYMKMIEDDRINELIKGSQHILIIACPGCPNESLAYLNGIPMIKEINSTGNETKVEYYAINQEIKRLTELFKEQGFFVNPKIFIEKYLCFISENDFKQLDSNLPESDVILVLGCAAAYEFIKKIFRTSMQVYLCMESITLFSYRYIYNSNQGIRYITKVQFAEL